MWRELEPEGVVRCSIQCEGNPWPDDVDIKRETGSAEEELGEVIAGGSLFVKVHGAEGLQNTETVGWDVQNPYVLLKLLTRPEAQDDIITARFDAHEAIEKSPQWEQSEKSPQWERSMSIDISSMVLGERVVHGLFFEICEMHHLLCCLHFSTYCACTQGTRTPSLTI